MPLDSRDPTNGELAIMIDGMRRDMTEQHSHTTTNLGKIEAKVDHTNGRVRKLEQGKYLLYGGLIVINAVFVPLAVWWFTKNLG